MWKIPDDTKKKPKEKPKENPWDIWGLSGQQELPITSVFFIDVLKPPKGGK